MAEVIEEPISQTDEVDLIEVATMVDEPQIEVAEHRQIILPNLLQITIVVQIHSDDYRLNTENQYSHIKH
jgi:hypothetical protein